MNGKDWVDIERESHKAAMRIANVQIQALGAQLTYERAIWRIVAGLCTAQAVVIVALGALLVWRW